jgi:hypothetical protein
MNKMALQTVLTLTALAGSEQQTVIIQKFAEYVKQRKSN